uniref:ABC1 atypical kinase-like domain-containing protein n=1 Tax=viral metagenome TaxID=1070528 RepID=A0A6C0J7A5_9ZZZZ
MLKPRSNESYFQFQRRFIKNAGYIKGHGIRGEYVSLILKSAAVWNNSKIYKQVAGAIEPHTKWIKHCGYIDTSCREEVSQHSSVKIEDIELGDRLGSISQDAYVRLGVVKKTGMKVAVKFIPILFKDIYKQGDPLRKFSPEEEEVETAMNLGKLAKEDPGLPFPITLGGGSVRIRLPIDFAQRDTAIKIDVYNKEFSINGKKRAAILAMRGDLSDHDTIVSAMYIVSELATGDLKQIRLTEKLASSAGCALNMLHNFNYTHGDPHLGNFLVLECGQVIIHDFGHSKQHSPEQSSTKAIIDDIQFDKEFLERAINS